MMTCGCGKKPGITSAGIMGVVKIGCSNEACPARPFLKRAFSTKESAVNAWDNWIKGVVNEEGKLHPDANGN